ncbi:uncharacterized protein [Porites lutea]|uniref:uncharacterized protein isoform X1 n=1 Tax=Porites lutea TaxID=51062 RepID=UPI003CC5CECE
MSTAMMQFDMEELLPAAKDSETKKHGVKNLLNSRFTFRLWQILVFLFVMTIITVTGILAAKFGPASPCYKISTKEDRDIDDCGNGSHDCHQNATCANTAGSFNCSCQSGFVGNGRQCHDINECSDGSHDCHQNAACINTPGQFYCSCQPGFTGDGHQCYDCSSYHFEKYQDLPTRGAHAVEHFTINGSLFLAFANHESDTTEKYNTDSFIYKFNDLTEKFFLYQTIGTHGGHDVEYFTISGEHYLAVANVQNENTFRLNSVIYLWNGTLFVAFQNLTTKGGASFNFFTIAKEPFLTACNLFDDVTKSINSTIYKWKNNMFEKFQEIATEAGRGSAAFVINNESYIAFANAVPSATSVVYKRAGMHFVELQNLQKHSAMNVKSFYVNDDVFLATASQPTQSFIHKWNGSQFFLFKTIPTYRARVLYPFVMCGQTFLGAANRRRGGTYHIKSVVYRFSQDQFTEYQKISTFGAVDMTSFEHKGYTYLAIANSGNENQKNINSTLYRWT